MNALDKVKAEAVADAHFFFALNLHHRLVNPTPDLDPLFSEEQMAKFVIERAWKQTDGQTIIDLALVDLNYPMTMRYRGMPPDVISDAIGEVKSLVAKLKPVHPA